MSDKKGIESSDAPFMKWQDIEGESVTKRTQYLGHDSHEYRKSVNLPPVHRDIQNKHNIFIHELGADVLKARLDEEKQLEMERAALEKKRTKVAKLLRRKIKVTDLEDGGVSISMDQEWDTSTWSEELIQAGCEALILIFYDSSGASSDERKERAVQMLQKLLFRHPSAELYVRKNIELMIGKAANKLIRGGKCAGLLDLLYILHSCKEGFLHEMSQANFNGRAIEMLMQETRLAAIIIQHAFRASRNAKQLYASTSLVKHVGFGTERDVRKSRLGVVNARTSELRAKWRAMHCFHPAALVKQIGGQRGPIHVGQVYTKLALEIILHLVSDAAGNRAQGNREDVVRADGCILLSTFLAAPSGPFSRLAAAILANLSHVWESFLPMLTSGCIGSAVRCMQYHRTVLDVGRTGLPRNKHEKVSAQEAYEHCLDLVTHTAQHAAGLYRACMGYRYIVLPHNGVERIDYRAVLATIEKRTGYSKVRLMDEVKAYLGHQKLLREMSAMIVRTEVPELLISALRCEFTILCSEAHDRAVTEITALQGVLINRIVQLVHHNNVELGALALCVCQALCTQESSRKQLVRVQVEKLLVARDAYTSAEGLHYLYPPLHRNLAFTAALCRQFNWRHYDPVVQHAAVMGLLPFNSNASSDEVAAHSGSGAIRLDPDSVRHFLYLDLLRTMRTTDLVTDERTEQQDLADWAILPNDERLCLGMSTAAGRYGAKPLVDFICHPDDPNYYESLPLDQSAASCVLLEGLSANPETALLSFSAGTINFMSKYIYLCKYLFLGKRMLNSQILVILNGVKSAVVALGRYARAIKAKIPFVDEYIGVAKNTELVASVLFFMNTLSISHPKLEKSTRDMQKVVGIGCLRFLSMYAELLVAANGKTAMVALADLYVPAQATVELIKYLKMVHKRSAAVVEIFSLACDFLCQVCETTEAGTIAIQEWKIFDSLRIYLPSPLSGILPLEEAEVSAFMHNPSLDSAESAAHLEYLRRKALIEEYKVGLMDLPVSFFILLANLCKIDEGKALSFSEGYVRRALDRLSVLNSKFIKHSAKYARHKHGEEWLKVSAEITSCLLLVKMAANYHHPKHGSSNDLILHELYEFVPLCKNIICWQLHTKYPRIDEILLCCYEALAAVAKDTYRINKIFEKFDLYDIIRHELAMLDSFPERGARAAVAIIDRSCHGLTSKYIVDIIPKLREPLAKVSRIYPQLSANVRDCNWTLTRSAKMYKETVDASYTPDQQIDQAMEEFIRSGNRYAHARASFMIGRSSGYPSSEASSPDGRVKHASTGGNSLLSAIAKVRELDEAHAFSPEAVSLAASTVGTAKNSPRGVGAEGEADVAQIRPGTYLHCGVTNCGSLLLPDHPHAHGTASALTLQEREMQLLKLTAQDPHDPTRCLISKLSARDPHLQTRIAENKSKAGFRDIKRYTPDATSTGSAVGSPSSPSPHMMKPISPQKDGKRSGSKLDVLDTMSLGSLSSFNNSFVQSPSASMVSTPAKGKSKASSKDLRSLSSPALTEKTEKIREILLTDLPELILTRPPKPQGKQPS